MLRQICVSWSFLKGDDVTAWKTTHSNRKGMCYTRSKPGTRMGLIQHFPKIQKGIGVKLSYRFENLTQVGSRRSYFFSPFPQIINCLDFCGQNNAPTSERQHAKEFIKLEKPCFDTRKKCNANNSLRCEVCAACLHSVPVCRCMLFGSICRKSHPSPN